MLFVEGTADRTLAWKLGVERGQIIWANGKGGVLTQLVRRRHCHGLVDEDPGTPQPSLLNRMAEITTDELRRLGLRIYRHGDRGNTLIVLCPKLEDWLIEAAQGVGVRMDDRRYALYTNANRLRDELKIHPERLHPVLDDLLSAQSPRILRLQALLTG